MFRQTRLYNRRNDLTKEPHYLKSASKGCYADVKGLTVLKAEVAGEALSKMSKKGW